jgi:hypothetical protein
MNHRPFSDWLLTDDQLSAIQEQSLQDHLQNCESCRQVEVAWLEVESSFKSIPQIKPPPGFTERWQLHLENYEKRKQRHQAWIPIAAIFPIILILLSVSTAQIWMVLKSPGPYLVIWFSKVIDLLSFYLSIQHWISPDSWNISIVTVIAMTFFVGLMSFMCVLWVAAYRKLSMVRRLA